MNSKYTNNQSVMSNQIITGNYNYNGYTYNAVIECTPNMFKNYADSIYESADLTDEINFQDKENSTTVFVNESLICGYDKKNDMLYVNIPDSAEKMLKIDAKKLEEIVESFTPEEYDEILSEVLSEEDNPTVSDKEIVLEFLQILEGYALRFKEFHWNSETKSMHETAEKAYDLVYSLEDSIAEDMMGSIDSRIKPGSINPIMPTHKPSLSQDDTEINFVDTLNMLRDDTFSFYKKIEHNNNFIGIRSEVENFTHELTQIIYLAKMI